MSFIPGHDAVASASASGRGRCTHVRWSRCPEFLLPTTRRGHLLMATNSHMLTEHAVMQPPQYLIGALRLEYRRVHPKCTNICRIDLLVRSATIQTAYHVHHMKKDLCLQRLATASARHAKLALDPGNSILGYAPTPVSVLPVRGTDNLELLPLPARKARLSYHSSLGQTYRRLVEDPSDISNTHSLAVTSSKRTDAPPVCNEHSSAVRHSHVGHS
ncbi:hypothetical protein BDY19DRAFT_325017 [Irpex rosettiformis]|uniref:Uncharacterized protein n=1 Tax=Irpex rosettiformis TaxID=378272 RepID=A0ACB8TYB4_9APHY|nr:hypothetical protein BDY19DRAFT_325017 [Irpex rosettiformis]